MFAFRLRNRRFRPLIHACAVPVLAGLLAVPATAEVPVENAYVLHLQTLPARRELSPFWGMAALKTGVLANVRFFGAYADVANPAFPAHPGLDTRYDQPQDAISGLVQYLFPSPDGRNLVPNERDNDPIGLIAREQRQPPAPTGSNPATNPPGNTSIGPIAEDKRGLSAPVMGLRKLMALLDAADAYREKLQSPSPATEAGEAFKEAVTRILAPAVARKEKQTRKRAFDTLRGNVATMMQQALLQEIRDKEDRYPPRIVETALLAYAWLVADSPAELQAAFPGLFLPQSAQPAHHQAGSPAVETKVAIVQPDAVEPHPGAIAWDNPAQQFIALVLRIRRYELTPTFLSMGNASWNGSFFPDCGETSLRNFFLAMLWTGGKSLDSRLITDLETRLTPEAKVVALGPAQVRFGQLIQFFKDHPDLAAQGTQECRNKWAAIVSDVNMGANDPLPVPYRTAGACNLAGYGVEAMLNLVAHLLPDPVLNAPWPEPGPARSAAIAGKLDRLCALFPRGGARLDWETDGGKRIAGPYTPLTFTNGTEPLFSWDFKEGHYDLTSYRPVPQHDPVITNAAFSTTDYWVKAIAWPRVPDAFFHDAHRVTFLRPNERYYFRHVGDEADNIIGAMVQGHGPVDLGVLSLLVYRGLPRSIDHYGNLSQFYVSIRERPERVIPGLRDLPQADRDRLLADSLSQGSLMTARLLVDHGARVDARDAQGRPMVHLAATDLGLWTLPKLHLLAVSGADFQARDARGRTALHAAAECGNVEAVTVLIGKGLDIYARDSEGKTPMDLARESASPFPETLPPSIRIYLEFLEQALRVENKTVTPALATPGPAATELSRH
jgi:hypothetical protein